MWLHSLHVMALPGVHVVSLAACGCLCWCIGSMLYLKMRATTWYVLPRSVCATDILEGSQLSIKTSRYPAENLLSNALGNVMHSLYCHPVLYNFISGPRVLSTFLNVYVLLLWYWAHWLFYTYYSNYSWEIIWTCISMADVLQLSCDTSFCINQCYRCETWGVAKRDGWFGVNAWDEC